MQPVDIEMVHPGPIIQSVCVKVWKGGEPHPHGLL